MFSGFKYRLAKNKVLMSLEVKGVLSKGKSKLMRDIMYNDMNKELGIECIRQGSANKYDCVAVVFARLQYLYERNPINDLSSNDWYYPTIEALIMAGYSKNEAVVLNKALLDEHSKSSW